ncbi:MAG: dynamin family protein, partial [Mailhella sp.]|nr:dynamin family protein [Mailhella sp.]
MERRIEAVPCPEPGTPSAIMPELPSSSAPELSAEDRLVVLLASAAQEGGRLSPSAWKKASDAFVDVFSPDGGEERTANARMKEEHAFFVLQTHFHAALLQPPLSASQIAGDSRIVEDIASLPGDRAERFLAALQELSPELASALLQNIPSEDGKEAGHGRLAEALRRSARFLSGANVWESVFGEGNEKDERNVAMENGVAVSRHKSRSFMPAPLKKQLDVLTSAVAGAGSACGEMVGSVAQAAVGQYQGAARYLRELSAQRRLSLLRSRREELELASVFASSGSAAQVLENAALEAGCLGSARSLEDLRRLMAEQPFTLVVVGEGKRGKSSLINALLGRAVSPVRESVPETASVARFRWGRDFRGAVHFLDEEECRQLGEFLKLSSKDETFAERVRRMLEEKPPQEDRELESEEALRGFLSAEGQGSVFTSRVDVELPAEALRHGLVLVDTPGLNATDPVQN